MKNSMYTPFARRMAKILSFVLIFALAISITSVPAFAATYTDEYVLETETIVLVDRSGSMKDRNAVEAVLAGIDTSNATLAYFDSHKLTLDANYNVGGNSSICEAIDAAARGGFTHIAVVTDAEQWPEDYTALGIYTDLDIKIFLTEEKDAEAEKLIKELMDSLVKSNLSIVHIDGTEEILMDDYVPEKHVISFEIPDPVIPEEEVPDHGDPEDGTATPPAPVIEQTVVECNHECVECTHNCPWWLVLLLGLLIAGLFDLIHELITRRRGWFGPTVGRIKKGAKMLLDVSGSMSSYRRSVIRAAKRGKATSLIAFGNEVVEIKPEETGDLDMGGATHGTEALKLAVELGWDEVVLVSDLGFNGEPMRTELFEGKHFKTITVLAPHPYDTGMVSELQKIADRVEVLSL